MPALHGLHAVEPEASWKLPAAHASHSDWRGLAVNVPGAHGELVVEPVAHELPSGQAVQSEAAASPAPLEYVPARQGSSAEAPGEQYAAREHPMQPVCPVAFW